MGAGLGAGFGVSFDMEGLVGVSLGLLPKPINNMDRVVALSGSFLSGCD